MGIETRPRGAAGHLDGTDATLACLEAAFEEGDPELVAAALNDVTRAKGLAQDASTSQSDISAVIRTLKGLDLEPTAKAA